MSEAYPCYVRIGGGELSRDTVELPTEKDGTMLLSTVQAQFPGASGLRFKSDTGGWKGIRCEGNVLDAPVEGWGFRDYVIVVTKKGKRKLDGTDGPDNKFSKSDTSQDLIVLGIPFAAKEVDLKNHFERFGELEMQEIKYDKISKKSKGYGFIRFKSSDCLDAVFNAEHIIMNRRCEVRYPNKREDAVPRKLFIGRLPKGTTQDDLLEHFSQYGELKDVYIPNPFRGFGFITFESEASVRTVLNGSHTIKGTYVNISLPEPKGQKMNAPIMRNNPVLPPPSVLPAPSYTYGTIQEYTQGNTQGYVQGSIAGQIPGNMANNIQSNIPGKVQSTVQGNMQGYIQSNYQGSVQGSIPGSIPGSIQGNLPGNLQGNLQGNIPVTMQGNIPGTIQGNIPGNIPGTIQGTIQGNIPGNYPGTIQGNIPGNYPGTMQGNIPGSIQGNIPGTIQGNLPGNVQVLQTSMQGNIQGTIPTNIQGSVPLQYIQGAGGAGYYIVKSSQGHWANS